MDVSPHPLLDLDWIKQETGKNDLTMSEALAHSDIVGPNILFDVDYYRSNYGHDIPSGVSCLEHFCRQEREQPRNPNPLFSTQQWHETVGWQFPEKSQWRRELFTSMGDEARFAQGELKRHTNGSVILNDREVGLPPSSGQEICLFIHYDHLNVVQSYVFDYLSALSDQGISIVFITNCHSLDEKSENKLRGRVWRVVYTDNKARDFGQYAIGVRLLDKLGFKNHPILLANDSVIATMHSLDPFFNLARSGEYEVVGAIDCHLHDWHLQSFFLYCSEKLVRSEAWRGFWDAYRPHHERWYVVNAHELGFSRWMGRHSVRMGAAWRYADLVKGADNGRGSEWRRTRIISGEQVTNPTIEMWDIANDAGFPFLKKALFTTPLEAGNLTDLCNVISGLNVQAQRRHSTLEGSIALEG